MERPSPWEPHFKHQELWVLNTAYKLFGPWGPLISSEATHRGRLDELAKCLAVAPPNAAVRLFWADAAVCVEGDDMSEWIRFLGKNAPSEQQIAKFLWPNVYAAWQGEPSSRSLMEAMRDWSPEQMDKPTPGVSIWKYELEQEDSWMQRSEGSRSWYEWPRLPTGRSMSIFLQRLNERWGADAKAVGLVLDMDGAFLRCFSANPLSNNSIQCSPAPQGLITVLGGPKGITTNFKATLEETFRLQGVPLLEVSLGPEDDAGLLRAAVTDLLLLGRSDYESLFRATEAAAHRLSRRVLGKKLWRGRRMVWKQSEKHRQSCALARHCPGLIE